MSWVIERAVAPSSRTHSMMRSLITSPMIGSSPVVGSSKKMISGSVAMARARPTRFFMPPESSAGKSSPTSAPSPTWPSLRSAISFASSRGLSRAWMRAKAVFSHTERLSNRAPPWNSMPNLRKIRSRSRAPMPTTSSPSISMLPSSGSSRPRMHLSSTDLPVPEPPITTTDSPTPTSRSSPSSTMLLSKRLCRLRMRILGGEAFMSRRRGM